MNLPVFEKGNTILTIVLQDEVKKGTAASIDFTAEYGSPS